MLPVTDTALVAIRKPTSRAPASPMKSFAGCQLRMRNPEHAPTSTAVSRDGRLKKNSVCTTTRLMKNV